MFKMLNIQKMNVPVYDLQTHCFEETMRAEFLYKNKLRTLNFNAITNTNKDPNNYKWLQFEFLNINNKDILSREDELNIIRSFENFCYEIESDFQKAIIEAFNVMNKNMNIFFIYLNGNKNDLNIEKTKAFERIEKDPFKSIFFDFTFKNELQISSPNQNHIIEEIIDLIDSIKNVILRYLENKNKGLFKLKSQYFTYNKSQLRNYKKTKEAAAYEYIWDVDNIELKKIINFEVLANGELEKKSSWSFFYNTLFFEKRLNDKDIMETKYLKDLQNLLNDLINDSFIDNLKENQLNKELLELNFQEIIESDYYKEHYLIQNVETSDYILINDTGIVCVLNDYKKIDVVDFNTMIK